MLSFYCPFHKHANSEVQKPTDNCIFCRCQSSGNSCATALIKLTDDWRSALDEKKEMGVIAIDLSKAFDCICHNLLLAKVKAYGVQEPALQLLRSYLHGASRGWYAITSALAGQQYDVAFHREVFLVLYYLTSLWTT